MQIEKMNFDASENQYVYILGERAPNPTDPLLASVTQDDTGGSKLTDSTTFVNGKKELLFGEIYSDPTYGINPSFGKILLKATVKKYLSTSAYPSNVKGNVAILANSLKFIDRGMGLTNNDKIILHNAYTGPTLGHPYYNSQELATNSSTHNDQLAFKLLIKGTELLR